MKNSKQILYVGSLITAFHKGWHIIIDITPRKGYTDLIEYQLVVDTNYQIHSNGKIHSCAAECCKAVTNTELKRELQEKMDLMKKAYAFLMEY